MDTGDVHPMNIDEESDDSVKEIGNPTQSEGVANPKKPNQPLQCRCKKCSKIYSAKSSSGTGNLKCHLEKCLKSTTRGIGQYMISSNKGVLDTRYAMFSQEKFRELLVHAVVRHDLPFSFIEYEGVRDVFKYLEPDVTHITRNTTKADMLKLHGVETIAIVFDPRYKNSFLEFSYAKLYGKDSEYLAKFKKVLYGVFDEHNIASKNATSSTSGSGSNMNDQEFDLFDKTKTLSPAEQQRKLDFYFHELRAATTSSICVLDFWKSQQYRYPVLAKLAMDILCVPISTVASESAFSLDGRILDQYQSSMKPSNVEALVCTRDWLFTENAMSHAELEKVTENIMALDINKDEE
uniref:Zinc finger BED domain-containing protein RICESLEEPER 2-like n=1 Tax=Tanacetum cinerariifolium TaxID=118510 RepID=A0A6L2LAK7_TANCI|nr:zinc finger BED domain-containing protein RICESLEEPER 2-like [Tanacetum cinerariifolium]